MATLMVVAQGLLMVLGGMVVLVKLLAPLTKSKFDDKLAGYLSKAVDLLKKVVA